MAGVSELVTKIKKRKQGQVSGKLTGTANALTRGNPNAPRVGLNNLPDNVGGGTAGATGDLKAAPVGPLPKEPIRQVQGRRKRKPPTGPGARRYLGE